MEKLLEAAVLYKCAARDGLVSFFAWKQLIWDLCYEQGMSEKMELTGSFYEGLPADVCGDQDVMRINKLYPIVTFGAGRDVEGDAVTLRAETDPTHPVYACLAVPEEGQGRLEPLFPRLVVVRGGVEYFSAECFIRQMCGVGGEIHGPASVQPALPGSPDQGSRDVVSCLVCPEWPRVARSFLRRPQGWPSVELLGQIERHGCLLVPIGHPACLDPHLQWRLSFSVAEKILLHDVDTDRIACMVILKIMKKRLWPTGSASSNGICSYFLKSVCLWVYESIPSGPIPILGTTFRILDYLIQCYRDNVLPHYFVPDQNLIAHIPTSTRDQVVRKLVEIRAKLSVVTLCSLSHDVRIDEVFNFIHKSTGMFAGDPNSSSQAQVQSQLEKIGRQTKGAAILRAAAKMLEEGGRLFFIQERVTLRFVLTPDVSTLFEIDKFIDFLEYLLLPMGENGNSFIQYLLNTIEEKQKEVVKPNYHRCFRTLLYRGTGHTFLLLYRYSLGNKRSQRLAALYYESAIRCLREGVLEWYPDGTNDSGLSGHVALAKFYHLNREWDSLSRTLDVIGPLRDNILAKPDIIDCAIPFTVYKDNNKFDILWKTDPLFHTHFLASWPSNIIRFHPICLSLYFEANLAYLNGNSAEVESCIAKLQLVQRLLKDEDFKASALWLVYVLTHESTTRSAL